MGFKHKDILGLKDMTAEEIELLLNTADNRFEMADDFDGDGKAEILISSPWGIGILKMEGGALSAPVMAANGDRFMGGWLLNTEDNRFI